jgi:4a-hydroxytetrahydrobiopterin dehydratase
MWQTDDNKLYKKIEFNDFSEALGFIVRVGLIAEKYNHHPTISNTYSTVEMWLSTHDAGDTVTEKDHNLAGKIDELTEGDVH